MVAISASNFFVQFNQQDLINIIIHEKLRLQCRIVSDFPLAYLLRFKVPPLSNISQQSKEILHAEEFRNLRNKTCGGHNFRVSGLGGPAGHEQNS